LRRAATRHRARTSRMGFRSLGGIPHPQVEDWARIYNSDKGAPALAAPAKDLRAVWVRTRRPPGQSETWRIRNAGWDGRFGGGLKESEGAADHCDMRRALYSFLVVLLVAALQAPAENRTYGSRNIARSQGRVSRARSVGGHTRTASSKCMTCERDANGRVKRNLPPDVSFKGSIPARPPVGQLVPGVRRGPYRCAKARQTG
jgi:hypothetical protein